MDSLYTESGMKDKNALWQRYIPLIRSEALRLQARLPASVELDDLLQVGGIGFLNAIEGYDPSHGASFSTYVVQRIRGAMLDELRSRDWIPRNTRREVRRMTQAIPELEQKLGRQPEETEIANHLSISLEEYRKILLDSNSSQIFSFDEMHEEMGDHVESFVTHHRESPLDELLDEEMRASVIDAIDQLPEKEKLILTLYYQESLNLKEIGLVLEVSESRVSQLHSQAIKRIQSILKTSRAS